MRLSVDPATGAIRLVMPPRYAERRALAWAQEQQSWIAEQRGRLPQPRPFVDGARVPLGDDEVTIVWRQDAPRLPKREAATLVCGGPPERIAARIEAWLKRTALAALTADTLRFAKRAGVAVDGVAIGDPRARWGSCSSRGNIRYSWRLILAPVFVQEATVAHEVAHRVHMNHAPAFHALVAELLGTDPGPAYRWLRDNGAALHWFGRAS
nr:SprT family zinc-dependent metalloprotease [Sphingomonas japonica]